MSAGTAAKAGAAIRVAVAATALALTACGGNKAAESEPQPRIEEYESARAAAGAAFERGRYRQAAQLYERVRGLAYQRDDIEAIVDAGYNGAVALAQVSRNEEANERLNEVRADIARGALAVPPEVDLLDATLRYRTGEVANATALLGTLTEPPLTLVGLRAVFLQGVIAAEAGDVEALENSIAVLSLSESPRIATDALELQGRRQLLTNDTSTALATFETVATQRVEVGALRAMTRALDLAATAAAAGGDRNHAADLWLRAGRSAASREDLPEARHLLGAAREAGSETESGASAATLLATLPRE